MVCPHTRVREESARTTERAPTTNMASSAGAAADILAPTISVGDAAASTSLAAVAAAAMSASAGGPPSASLKGTYKAPFVHKILPGTPMPAFNAFDFPPEIVVSSYDVELVVTGGDHGILAGSVRAHAFVTEPATTVVLHALGLTTKSAALYTGSGTKIVPSVTNTFNGHSNDFLQLKVAEPLRPGPLTIEISYTGSILGLDAGTGGSSGGAMYKTGAVVGACSSFLLSSGLVGGRSLFPCIDNPAVRATVRLTLATTPDVTPYSVAPVATVTGPNKKNLDVYEFATTNPMAMRHFGLAVGAGASITAHTAAGVVVRMIASERAVDDLEPSLAFVVELIEFFVFYFNAHFPVAKLDVVVAAGRKDCATQLGLVVVSPSLILLDGDSSDGDVLKLCLELSRAVCRQFIGGLAGFAWPDSWFEDGLTSWLAAHATHTIMPSLNTWLDYAMATYTAPALRLDGVYSHSLGEAAVLANPAQCSIPVDELMRTKAPALVRMLAEWIGPNSAWRTGLRACVAKYAHAAVAAVEWLDTIECESGMPVAAVLAPWVSRASYPVVFVRELASGGGGGSGAGGSGSLGGGMSGSSTSMRGLVSSTSMAGQSGMRMAAVAAAAASSSGGSGTAVSEDTYVLVEAVSATDSALHGSELSSRPRGSSSQGGGGRGSGEEEPDEWWIPLFATRERDESYESSVGSTTPGGVGGGSGAAGAGGRAGEDGAGALPLSPPHDRRVTVVVAQSGAATVVRVPARKHGWLCLNSAAAGYYRVNYAPPLFHTLRLAIADGSARLSLVDAVALLDDTYALSRLGHVPLVRLLQLLPSFAESTDLIVWKRISEILKAVRRLYVEEAWYPTVQEYGRSLMQSVLRKVGFAANEADGPDTPALRALVVDSLGCYDDDEEVAAHCVKVQQSVAFKNGGVDEALSQAISRTAVRHSGQRAYLSLRDEANGDAAAETRNFRAYGALREGVSIALGLLFDELTEPEALLEIVDSVADFAEAREVLWRFVRDHWPDVLALYDGSYMVHAVLEMATRSLTTRQQAADVQRFFTSSPFQGSEESVRRCVARIVENASWADANKSEVREWLHGGGGAAAPVVPYRAGA